MDDFEKKIIDIINTCKKSPNIQKNLLNKRDLIVIGKKEDNIKKDEKVIVKKDKLDEELEKISQDNQEFYNEIKIYENNNLDNYSKNEMIKLLKENDREIPDSYDESIKYLLIVRDIALKIRIIDKYKAYINKTLEKPVEVLDYHKYIQTPSRKRRTSLTTYEKRSRSESYPNRSSPSHSPYNNLNATTGRINRSNMISSPYSYRDNSNSMNVTKREYGFTISVPNLKNISSNEIENNTKDNDTHII